MYNIWNKWDKLKTVCLGTVHPIEFFDNIKNKRISDPLKRITEETMEDLANYESVLKDFGCTVIRTQTHINEKDITKYPGNIPRNALQPRDSQLVIGNKLVMFKFDNIGIANALKKYNQKDMMYDPEIMRSSGLPVPFSKGSNSGRIEAPCITVIGKRIIIDTLDIVKTIMRHHKTTSMKIEDAKEGDVLEWIKSHFPNFEYIEIDIGGHSDGSFHAIKPGAILALNDFMRYKKSFPGWDVCYLPDQSWGKIGPFMKLKEKVNGKWWLPGEEDNDDFTNYVESWLGDWVGYCEETVFDVNVLVLDEHHVCVSQKNNKQVNDFLKKHHMEPIYIPWRHRYFWDGGLHCITLDLEREGRQKDYFSL